MAVSTKRAPKKVTATKTRRVTRSKAVEEDEEEAPAPKRRGRPPGKTAAKATPVKRGKATATTTRRKPGPKPGQTVNKDGTPTAKRGPKGPRMNGLTEKQVKPHRTKMEKLAAKAEAKKADHKAAVDEVFEAIIEAREAGVSLGIIHDATSWSRQWIYKGAEIRGYDVRES